MASSDPTLTELPTLEELFDRPSLDDWRRIAEASLKGRPLERLTVETHEGIEIAPLATAADTNGDPGYPGRQPFVRGRTALGPGAGGWEVCQRIGHPNPEVAARQAREELGRGANSLWLVFDPATRTDADHADPICVQVLDRGWGMDEETMKRALLPFYSTKKTGSGLGLALCREIVEGHGGRISLQHRPGGGTIVSCWFPDYR